jgi:hypothetical protein
MKKVLTFCILTIAAFNANAQVKKVILEDFTGTWCGWCPEGTVRLEQLLAAHPTNFIPIASHSGDALEITDANEVPTALGVTGFPMGAVDRFQFSGQSTIAIQRTEWSDAFDTRAALTAKASVSFTNTTKVGNTYTATVNVKFTSAPTAGVPIKMNVYILEDSIPAIGALEQHNYSSDVQNGDSPLTNWYLNSTVRKPLGGVWGYADMIPSTVVVGTNYTKNITFTLDTTWIAKHINIVAFVAYDGGATENKKEIINAEQMALRSFGTGTAIKEIESNLQASVYPNPARMNSYIKTSFTLKEDAIVSMKVINALGQVVSEPYISFEIKGTHTIQWSPLENAAIVPGVYFLQLSTNKGDGQTSRLVIQ